MLILNVILMHSEINYTLWMCTYYNTWKPWMLKKVHFRFFLKQLVVLWVKKWINFLRHIEREHCLMFFIVLVNWKGPDPGLDQSSETRHQNVKIQRAKVNKFNNNYIS